ncbi:MAG: excinuclease ABC subunit UvrA [Bacteroidetes bacterium]|nr:excinuclease ABC subunit UvrA [Bacteroidota bacterium]MBL0017370.1 excinuclease ABC subunit UvrA [Bacteroidota bacterium]
MVRILSGIKNILIKGARVNNLKNITVEIPRKQLVVITGVSGSGKSSLAFDTLYAEGQRRYVESLSSYARQFLDRMEKPDVDYIQGISPALAIEQRKASGNPRSTVGTLTEIYDFLKLLFARAGKTYSPISGDLVTRDQVSDVVNYILKQEEGTKVYLASKVKIRSQGYKKELEVTLQKGFSRMWVDGRVEDIEGMLEGKLPKKAEDFLLLIDRLAMTHDDDEALAFRLSDSVQTAYQEGFGSCLVKVDDGEWKEFSEKFERDGIAFEAPSVDLFSFNNPYGACKACEGFGRILGIDEDLVIPNRTLSLFESAVAPWRGEHMQEYLQEFLKEAAKHDFPIHRPWHALTEEQKDKVRDGLGKAWGYNQFFTFLGSQLHKIQNRVMLSRYRGYTRCPECKGSRIRKDASYVKVGGQNIGALLGMEITDLQVVIENLQLDERERHIAARILNEIKNRLEFLVRVGVGYLTLNRQIHSLSGGEMQRIKLSTSLGSGLVGAMYILDEPSIGLHPRDTERLISVVERLRDKGNTVIVVEHDEAMIRRADYLIDMGPGAGELGGEVVFAGTSDELLKSDSLTSRYLTGREEIPLPKVRRKKINSIRLLGAMENNLKNVSIEVPLQAMTVVTGVSGSGKSTLITKILYPAVKRQIDAYGEKPGHFDKLEGDLDQIGNVEMVDQSPIGRSARSNPVTYIKAYDAIRDLYADQPAAKVADMKAGHFSFNVEGGRCETCKGEGFVTIEMQFLPDITLKCEECHGRRFRKPVLQVKYKGKNIDDVLNMTINEASEFFVDEPKIVSKLSILNRVGLGYLRMGQSSSTLSGGEAQRVKLAFFLSQGKDKKGTMYIFDEPTTGLHFEDIKKLLYAMNELVERGNTVLVVEHNLEMIKCADWLIDLGPEGGDKGGQLVYQGPPLGILDCAESKTGPFLRDKLIPVKA